MRITLSLSIFIFVIPFRFNGTLFPSGSAIAVPNDGERYPLCPKDVYDMLERNGLTR